MEQFANEFLKILANIENNENEDNSENQNIINVNSKGEKSNSKSDDKNNEEEKNDQKKEKRTKKGGLFTICEINYYHLVLFSYMISSKLRDKEEFNRISVLVSSKQFEQIYNILGNLENIDLKGNNFGKEKSKFLLFNYENDSKNNISFLLEQKRDENEDKSKKKKIEPFSQIEFCSILAKNLFQDEPIIILLTIALKYWAIQRKIFKSDFTIKQSSKRIVLDDVILLYFIYYFLMHKGIKEQNLIIKQNKKNSKEKKDDKPKEIKLENNGLDERKVLLKELGELFVEFFWFIHELIKLTENNSEKKEKNKLIIIDLSKKSILTENRTDKDVDESGIPYSMILEFDDGVLCTKLSKKDVYFLKKECTRALYYLLNREVDELFTFKQYYYE